MKRFLAFSLVLALTVSLFTGICIKASDSDASDNQGSLIITNRAFRTAGLSQDITDEVKKHGSGTYFMSMDIKLLNCSALTDDILSAGVLMNLGMEVAYTDGSYSWKNSTKVLVTSTDWVTVASDVNVSFSSGKEISTVVLYLQSLKNDKDKTDYKGDLQADNIIIKFSNNGTLGENLVKDPYFDSDPKDPASPWTTYNSCKISNPAPSFYGGTLVFTKRTDRTTGPKQDLVSILNANGPGEYTFGGLFRLLPCDKLTSAISSVGGPSVQIGIYYKSDSGAKFKNTTFIQVSDSDVHNTTRTLNFDFTGTVTEAYMYIHTVTNTSTQAAYTGDVEVDNFVLTKTVNGKASENLLTNPYMNINILGETEGWTTYGSTVMTNTVKPTIDFTSTENADGTITYKKGFVPVTDKNIYYSGRWNVSSTVASASFESYVQLKFTGTSIALIPGASGKAYYELDGQIQQVVLASTTVIANNLAEGEHTLRIYSAAQQAFPTITGFVIDENASTLPYKPDMIIEFIGDSIMEGYFAPADKVGTEANNSMLNSYGYKTGKLLMESKNAAFNIVAFGGIGICRRAAADSGQDILTMPERYFLEREYIRSDASDTVAKDWDTSKYVPDYIVINLGTNDGSASITSEAFITAYTGFVRDLLDCYDGVEIFLMTPFNGTRRNDVITVVETLNSSQVKLIDSALWGVEGGSDNLHPAPAGHDLATEKLYSALNVQFAKDNSILGASLELGESLTLNYYSKLDDAESLLHVTRNGKTVALRGEYDASMGYYKFAYTGINAQCMTDTVDAVLKNGDVVLDEHMGYSVKQNAENLAKDADEELLALLSDMLIYGAEAQKYANYKTDTLATDNVEWLAGSKYVEPTNTVKSAENNLDGYTVKSAGLEISNTNRIYFKLSLRDTSVTVKVDGMEAELIALGNNEYIVYTDGISATEFALVHTVTVTDGNEFSSASYNVNAYLKNKSDSALVKALACYGASCENY